MPTVDPSQTFNVDIIITHATIEPSYITYCIKSDDYIDDRDAKIMFGNNNFLNLGNKSEKICNCHKKNNCDNNNNNICCKYKCKKNKMHIISKQEYNESNTPSLTFNPYLIISDRNNITPLVHKLEDNNNIYKIFGHFNTSLAKMKKTTINLSKFAYHYDQIWNSNGENKITLEISKNYNTFEIASNFSLPSGYMAANSVKYVFCIENSIYDFAEIEKSSSTFTNRTIIIPKKVIDKNKLSIIMIQSDNLFIVLQNKNVISTIYKYNPTNHLEISV